MLNAAHILYTATACYPGSRVVIVPGYLIVLPGHRTRTVLRAIGLLRLTAEGRLLLCLGNEHSMDLREVLRSYPGNSELLKSKILEALKDKPERHYFDPEQVDIVRFMNMTGG